MSFSDGIFECVLIRKPRNVDDLRRAIMSFLSGKVDEKVIVYEKSSKVEVIGMKEIPWVVDGEYAGDYKHSYIENHTKKIDILLEDKSTYNDPLA